MYQLVDGGYAVFASKAGADTNPDWFHNLKANPATKIEVGTEAIEVKARIAVGVEHDSIWSIQKTRFPTFAEYEEKTARDHIPVVVLEVVSSIGSG
jgi:deazaflavin-dependent oxidoreductase (nitroreductase family)